MRDKQQKRLDRSKLLSSRTLWLKNSERQSFLEASRLQRKEKNSKTCRLSRRERRDTRKSWRGISTEERSELLWWRLRNRGSNRSLIRGNRLSRNWQWHFNRRRNNRDCKGSMRTWKELTEKRLWRGSKRSSSTREKRSLRRFLWMTWGLTNWDQRRRACY